MAVLERGVVASKPSYAIWRLLLMSIGQLGVQFTWTLEFALTTPFFEKTIGTSQTVSHAVWLLGPLSGMIMAPLVGGLSDRLGTRRPFILVFLCLSVTGMFFFGSATTVVPAVVAFGVMDFALNGTMWPLRALYSDAVNEVQQHDVQSAAAVNASMGEILSSLFVWSLAEPVTYVRTALLVSCVLLVLTVVVSVALCSDRAPYEAVSAAREAGSDGEPITDDSETSDALALPNWMSRFLSAISHRLGRGPIEVLPNLFMRHAAVFSLGCLSFFCIVPNLSTWVGSTVLGGDPSAPPKSKLAMRYEQGVALYSVANAVKSLVGLVFSLLYPTILRKIGVRKLFVATYGLLTTILLLGGFFGAGNVPLAFAIIVLTAIPSAVIHIVPAAIIVERYPYSRGSFLGILNLFNVIPQLIDTAYTGRLASRFGEGFVIGLGGVWALGATVLAAWLL